MVSEGKPVGWRSQSEMDHYIRCPQCGALVDMRDLGEVLNHLHGQEIDEEPATMSVTCATCDGTGWVCENHPDRPWEGPRARGCGGAGAPCPACNIPADSETPRILEGYRVELDKDGWRH
ncbi:hypothetical protein [Bradyrhizobium sp. CCBAU 11434]|uniref:hypothetical protein n=1 Tax=Bradyrhizobium sp. CCBAU 11434 TaxID=1630885 RepID=UPI0023058B90|nr:hypothetical protein [Bradyrhizobium sp. CCBAU 11434]